MKTGIKISLSILTVVIFLALHQNSFAACTELSRNLRIGSRDISSDMEVTKLQQFLMSRNESNWSSVLPSATGYYGKITEQAMKNFQAGNGIISSGGPYTTGYGALGPKTRAKIKELSCNSVSTNAIQNTDHTIPSPIITITPSPTNTETNTNATTQTQTQTQTKTTTEQTTQTTNTEQPVIPPTTVAQTTQTTQTTQSSVGITTSPTGTTAATLGSFSYETYTKPGTAINMNLSYPVPSTSSQTIYGGYKITPNLIIPGGSAGYKTAIYLIGPQNYQLKAPGPHMQLQYIIPTSFTAGMYKLRYEIFDSSNNLVGIREGGALNILQDSEIANTTSVQFVVEPTGALWLYRPDGVKINVYPGLSKEKLLQIANSGIGISLDAPAVGGTITFGQNYELKWHPFGSIGQTPFSIDKMTLNVTDIADHKQGAILFVVPNTNNFVWDTISYKKFCTTMTFDVGHTYRLEFNATGFADQGIKSVWYESGQFSLVN